MGKKTFSVISLGCFRNNYDSELMAKNFSDKGYVFKEKLNDCDTLVINTCGFIDKAKKESLEVINEVINLKKKKKVKKILVFGCMVTRYENELKNSFPEVDEWLPIVEFKPTFAKRMRLASSHVDFLKICEGCLNRCSFCAIPIIKGSLCSRPKSEVVKEAKFLDKLGVKELNIIGQDITSWGKDFKKKEDLSKLIKSILKETKNIKWIRLIYTHPKHLSDSVIELIAKEDRICKYIDLPIQHINDRILKVMNRKITKGQISSLISKIRKRIPDCVLRTSIIVGFPTETEKEFKELLSFLKDIKFERLGAFTYSDEEGTKAYQLHPKVHHSTKKRRFNEVMSLQQEIALKVNSRFVGKDLNVLIEKEENKMFIGRSQFDAPEVDGCIFVKRKGLKVGSFCKAKITDVYGYDLRAA